MEQLEPRDVGNILNNVEYEIPLKENEFLNLGRVTAILSQIDHLLTEVLSSASGTPAWAAYIFSEKATMSAKISMLDNIVAALPPEQREVGKPLIKALHRTNDDRNTLFHGIWAFHYDPNTERGKPACIWQKKKPVLPSDLPEIARRAAALSRQLGEFLASVNENFRDPPWSAPRRLCIATENVDLTKVADGKLKRGSQ